MRDPPPGEELEARSVDGDAGETMALETRKEDAERELGALHRKASRHLMWVLLGVSPAAIIPALGLAAEGSEILLLVLMVLVTLTQGLAYARTRSRARELEEELALLGPGPSQDSGG